MKDTNYTINCKGKLLNIDTPKIMGIVNVTPDSFYDGGKIKSDETLLKLVEKHLCEGADIIDIGGYSSRPNALDVAENEEKDRVVEAIEAVLRHFPSTIISVDTFRSKVAETCLQNGASIINDISAFEIDDEMPLIVKKYNAPYIIMHMQGTPQTMQNNPEYKNVTIEISNYFSHKIQYLNTLGVNDVIIDPGFGFGKTIEHNFEILKNLEHLSIFDLPILCGFSRKSMIWKTLNVTPKEALNGTTVLNTLALTKKCKLLRVHDVKEAKECIELYNLTK